MNRLDALVAELDALPWAPHTFHLYLPLLDEAIPLADRSGDVWRSFSLRARLVGICHNLDLTERALVALAWCLATAERDPAVRARDGGRILRTASSVSQSLHDVPDLPVARIVAFIDDLEERHRRAGLSLRSIAAHRQLVLMHLGDLDGAAEAFARWWAMPREGCWIMDCEVCEIDGALEWYAAIGRDAEAVAIGRPVFDGTAVGADESCEHIRSWIFANALAPLLRLGRLDEARSCHERGIRTAVDSPSRLDQLAAHLVYLAAVGETGKALSVLERHLGLADRLTEHGRFGTDTAFRVIVEALRRQGVGDLRLRLPTWHFAHSPSGVYDVPALADTLAARLAALAARYDARNGNTWVSSRLAGKLALLDAAAAARIQ